MREEHQTRSGSGREDEAQAAAPDPIDRLLAEHAVQLELCDALEFIADGLPDCVDGRLVHAVIAILDHGLTPHFRAEEQLLFPLLRRHTGSDPSLVAALDQLEMEHVRDEDICAELVDELRVLGKDGRARNADMLGYMLRGYFEGQRRHIAWENAVVLPAARRLLTPQDMQELANLQGSAPMRLAGFFRPRRT